MEIGIVGLPNVGKSSLFNALTGAAAAAENFPFTTIEPNIGVVPLPDERLQEARMIGQMVENVGGCQPESFELASKVRCGHGAFP